MSREPDRTVVYMGPAGAARPHRRLSYGWQSSRRPGAQATMTRELALLQALRDIVAPLAALRRQAETEGGKLSGRAYGISRDPAYLQSIAQAAIRAYEATSHDPRAE